MTFDPQAFRKVADALHDYPECKAALAEIERLRRTVHLDRHEARRLHQVLSNRMHNEDTQVQEMLDRIDRACVECSDRVAADD